MNIGILGTGNVARSYHFPALKAIPNATITAICNEGPKPLALASAEFPSARKYTQLTEMLRGEELDLVDIATPGFTHEANISQCLSKQVSVMVEKPTVVGESAARKLMELEKTSGAKIYPILNYRFRDASLQLSEAIQRGWIGTPEDLTCVQHGSSIYGNPRWAWDENRTGGLLYEWAFHLIDLSTLLLGRHKRVLGVKSTFEPSLNMHTAISALVEFNNSTATFNFKWFSSASFTRFDISGSVSDATVKFQPDMFFLRTGDTSPLDEFLGELRRVSQFALSLMTRRFKQQSYQPHFRVLSNIIESFERRTPAKITMRDVLPTIELVDAIRSRLDCVSEDRASVTNESPNAAPPHLQRMN